MRLVPLVALLTVAAGCGAVAPAQEPAVDSTTTTVTAPPVDPFYTWLWIPDGDRDFRCVVRTFNGGKSSDPLWCYESTSTTTTSAP